MTLVATGRHWQSKVRLRRLTNTGRFEIADPLSQLSSNGQVVGRSTISTAASRLETFPPFAPNELPSHYEASHPPRGFLIHLSISGHLKVIHRAASFIIPLKLFANEPK